MKNAPKSMSYGHGNCIIILVGETMGLAPSLVDDAKRHLAGGALHPVTGAAMELEAVRLNDLLRHDPALVNRANAHADGVKAQYGFANSSPVGRVDL